MRKAVVTLGGKNYRVEWDADTVRIYLECVTCGAEDPEDYMVRGDGEIYCYTQACQDGQPGGFEEPFV